MNVVIVNESLAYPPTSGNRIRTLSLMLRMARRHRITYVCRNGDDPGTVRQGTAFLHDHGIRTVVAEACTTPPPSRASRCAGLAANVFSPLPYAVASHNSPAVRAACRACAGGGKVDLWQFEWLAYADALAARHSAPRLMMAHNVESLIWQRYCETEPDPLKRWYVRRQWHKFECYERRVFAAVDRVIAVSPSDADLLRRRFGVRHVSVVDNGVDTMHFGAAASGVPREPGRILFLGSLDWRPNQDAVRLLLDQIFPTVHAAEPAARLGIVGRNPPPWLARRAAADPDTVSLHADVPDVRPHLARSAVMVVPLRIGGGSRIKILEAFASGLPVVSTRVGCEGLAVRDGRELLVVEDIGATVDALLDCLRHRASAAERAERGRQLVRDQYDWDPLADRLDLIWQQCVTSERPRVPQPAARGLEPELF
jgi:glycosyltransferase involved in cell wall biosynthesis